MTFQMNTLENLMRAETSGRAEILAQYELLPPKQEAAAKRIHEKAKLEIKTQGEAIAKTEIRKPQNEVTARVIANAEQPAAARTEMLSRACKVADSERDTLSKLAVEVLKRTAEDEVGNFQVILDLAEEEAASVRKETSVRTGSFENNGMLTQAGRVVLVASLIGGAFYVNKHVKNGNIHATTPARFGTDLVIQVASDATAVVKAGAEILRNLPATATSAKKTLGTVAKNSMNAMQHGVETVKNSLPEPLKAFISGYGAYFSAINSAGFMSFQK